MTRKLPNKGIPIPQDYIENMRHYLPDLPLVAIKDAWLHNATPAEVMAHFERISVRKKA